MAVRNNNWRCSSEPGYLPPSAVPAAGDNHRTGPIGHQAFHVHFAVDVIQTQLHQSSPLLDQVSVFRNHVAMTAAAYADADHKLGDRE